MYSNISLKKDKTNQNDSQMNLGDSLFTEYNPNNSYMEMESLTESSLMASMTTFASYKEFKKSLQVDATKKNLKDTSSLLMIKGMFSVDSKDWMGRYTSDSET